MEETQSVTYEKGKLYNIALSDLYPDPNQPRKFMDPTALDELTASITKHGVLEPILFRAAEDLLYAVAGERRVEAARKAGLTTIPAIFIEGNHAEISLVENLLRQDLTAVEEAEALKGLMDGQKYTQEQLSTMIGKAPSTISEILSLNKLPQEVRDERRSDPAISKNILIEIAKSKQQRGMLSQYKKYKAKNLSKEALKQQRKRDVKAPSQIVLTAMSDLTERIGKLDITQLTDADTDADKEGLKATLTSSRPLLMQPLSLFLRRPQRQQINKVKCKVYALFTK